MSMIHSVYHDAFKYSFITSSPPGLLSKKLRYIAVFDLLLFLLSPPIWIFLPPNTFFLLLLFGTSTTVNFTVEQSEVLSVVSVFNY